MRLHRSRRLPLLLGAFALVAIPSGCAALVAGAGVGFLVSQQVLPNDTHLAQVRMLVDEVWPVATDTLSFYIDPGTELEIQDYPRVVKGEVGKAKVVVEVEAHDIDRTLIRVKATKYFSNDNTTAKRVMDAILERLAP